MTSPAEVLEAVRRERGRLLAAVDALGERATSVAVTTEGWTAKDVLAHLMHWQPRCRLRSGWQWSLRPTCWPSDNAARQPA